MRHFVSANGRGPGAAFPAFQEVRVSTVNRGCRFGDLKVLTAAALCNKLKPEAPSSQSLALCRSRPIAELQVGTTGMPNSRQGSRNVGDARTEGGTLLQVGRVKLKLLFNDKASRRVSLHLDTCTDYAHVNCEWPSPSRNIEPHSSGSHHRQGYHSG